MTNPLWPKRLNKVCAELSPADQEQLHQHMAVYWPADRVSRWLSELGHTVSATTVLRAYAAQREAFVREVTRPPQAPAVAESAPTPIPEATEAPAEPSEPPRVPVEVAWLEEQGLNPDEWEISTVRRLKDGTPSIGYRKRQQQPTVPLTEEERELIVAAEMPPFTVEREGATLIVMTADWQLFKGEGGRTPASHVDLLMQMAAAIQAEVALYVNQASELLLVFNGDLIEGFTSSGGANIWRTQMDLTTQMRIARRVALQIIQSLAGFGLPMTVISTPSNHGQTVRLGGKVATSYSDNFCTEVVWSIFEVWHGSGVNEHIKFIPPAYDTDIVTLDTKNGRVTALHGHQINGASKRPQWIQGQRAAPNSPMRDTCLFLMSHYHHFSAENLGGVMLVSSGHCEGVKGSSWFSRATGIETPCSSVVMLLKDGRVPVISQVEVIE